MKSFFLITFFVLGFLRGNVRASWEADSKRVLLADYVLFLNEVAAADPQGFYKETMACLMIRSGEPGTYRYDVISEKRR